MLRLGGFGRRTVLMMLLTCTFCFYLGRWTNSGANYDGCNKYQRGGEIDTTSRGKDPSNDNNIFSDDPEDLDSAVQRYMGKGHKVIDDKKPPPNNNDKHESPHTDNPTSPPPKCPAPPKCYKSSIVRDNERVGQRGPLPIFSYKDCKPEKMGTGDSQWQFCPLNIGKESKIFSFGITPKGGTPNLSFEKDMLDAYDLTTFIFDPLPKASELANRLIDTAEGVFKEQVFEQKFRYFQLGLGEKDGSRSFTPEGVINVKEGTLILPVVRLTTALCMFAPDWIDILKIDIPSIPKETIKDLEKVEEIPADQLLVRLNPVGKDYVALSEREELIKSFKRKGFAPWQGDPMRDEQITYVRYTYLYGDPPLQ